MAKVPSSRQHAELVGAKIDLAQGGPDRNWAIRDALAAWRPDSAASTATSPVRQAHADARVTPVVHHRLLDARRPSTIPGPPVVSVQLKAATIARVRTFAFSGIETVPVEVQVQISSGIPALLLVGLPDKAVGEARERVRAASAAMGLALPPRRVLINLAPADLLKEGSHFDLPIALAVLAAMDVLPREELLSATPRWANCRWTAR